MKARRPPMSQDELHRNVARIATAAEKVVFEVERLRRDVTTLCGRIEPFEGEVKLPEPPGHATPIFNKKSDLHDAMMIFDQARRYILGCECELTAIRGRMDAIESDAISREEMKPWIKI